jgi:hypothetical protein
MVFRLKPPRSTDGFCWAFEFRVCSQWTSSPAKKVDGTTRFGERILTAVYKKIVPTLNTFHNHLRSMSLVCSGHLGHMNKTCLRFAPASEATAIHPLYCARHRFRNDIINFDTVQAIIEQSDRLLKHGIYHYIWETGTVKLSTTGEGGVEGNLKEIWEKFDHFAMWKMVRSYWKRTGSEKRASTERFERSQGKIKTAGPDVR